MSAFPPCPKVELCTDLKSSEYDGLVVVAHTINDLPIEDVKRPLKALQALDKKADKSLFILPCDLPCQRIIFSGTGPLTRDHDDVRSYAEAAQKGVARAIEAGCQAPCLFFHVLDKFPQAALVTVLGALRGLYVPLEVREAQPDQAKKVQKIGIFDHDHKVAQRLDLIQALEAGRIVSRDIGGSDPERMAAPRVEEYVRRTFENTGIKVEVIQGQATFEKDYPCFAAVNRCASGIPRHDGRIIWLTYEPEGPVEKTLMLVGKGITYDTGGLDIKAGGVMAGMSRDKCGAADVAGILKAMSMIQPKGVKVIGAMAMARNSCGSNGYVSDEIITSRAGVRIRVGNTDAEGRMAMVDVLCHMKEKALNEVNPHMMTVATLTGHACLAMGPYTAVMDNGAARKIGFAQALQKVGEDFGNPFEISSLRREDMEKNRDKSGEFVAIFQGNNAPSTRTPRGHQMAPAFMIDVSGLDKHMMEDERPLKYSHLDVAGSSGDLPEPTNAASVIPRRSASNMTSSVSTLPKIGLCSDLKSSDYDGIVVVSHSVDDLPLDELKRPLKAVMDVDQLAVRGLFVVPCDLPCKRIIFSGTGPLNRDHEDVRSYAEAAQKGVGRAIKAGCRAPCLFFNVRPKFPQAVLVTILGGLRALYVPLEMLEANPKRAQKAEKMGIFSKDQTMAKDLKLAQALEAGRIVSRDIGGSDPERMAAPRVEEYVRQVFENTGIKVEVIQGQATFEKDYPCFAAVNRCASGIPRHDGRIIWLTYEPEGPVEKTLMLVGKGITYDTGGLDIKTGGGMMHMSRDKCGAADLAGVMKTLSILKPKQVKVICGLAMARNSCGSDGYVADEIVTSRAGVRMRIGNTDAEGRMAMADVLCHMKEKALKEVNPHLMTVATLTSHAFLSHGMYSVIMDNGPAREEGFALKLQKIGHDFGNPFEISTLRRDDVEMNRDKSGEFVSLVQSNNASSAQTMRGHQMAPAFMMSASGLDQHMVEDKQPLKYTHLDIAGSCGPLPEPSTAASVIPLVMSAIGQ
ncbi:hypothetical protein TCAL_04410 [Tigriopus californicus]|uniref:Cytosol aminopeptidase domain-containing protein n=2 Tax=Tigriopus californicus TaxID=6832 RepID=A0A553N6F2_TIGCA|nr:hypothetical protein TCAL_04410 [Tigriopus californicus]